jgi:hypothetical protein
VNQGHSYLNTGFNTIQVLLWSNVHRKWYKRQTKGRHTGSVGLDFSLDFVLQTDLIMNFIPFNEE